MSGLKPPTYTRHLPQVGTFRSDMFSGGCRFTSGLKPPTYSFASQVGTFRSDIKNFPGRIKPADLAKPDAWP
jgi:hypothetical protein